MDRAKWELLQALVCLILPLMVLGIFVAWLFVYVLARILGLEPPASRFARLFAIFPPLAGLFGGIIPQPSDVLPPPPPTEVVKVVHKTEVRQLVVELHEADFPTEADKVFEAYETLIPRSMALEPKVWQQDFWEFFEFLKDMIEETRVALSDPEQVGGILAEVIVTDIAIGIPVAAILAVARFARKKARERNSNQWEEFGEAGTRIAELFQIVPRARRAEIVAAIGMDYDDVGHWLHLLPLEHSPSCFWSPLVLAQ